MDVDDHDMGGEPARIAKGVLRVHKPRLQAVTVAEELAQGLQVELARPDDEHA